MDKCINTKHPEFIKLAKQVNMNPLILKSKIGVWQEKNNSDDFPTLEELGSNNNIKEGVAELFESNPELANAVYEALGFKEQQYVSKLKEIAGRRKLATKSDLENSQLIKDLRVDKSQPKELKPNAADKNLASIMLYGHRYSDLSNREYIDDNLSTITNPAEMQSEAELLAYRILNDFMFDMDELVFYQDILLENPEYASVLSTNENPVKEFFENDIFEQADKEKFEITPEQKQEAQQVYSQYLDTIFPDSKVKDIVYHGTDKKIDKFEIKRESVIHFGTKTAAKQRGEIIHSILLNINKLLLVEDNMFYGRKVLNDLKNNSIITTEQELDIIDKAESKRFTDTWESQQPYGDVEAVAKEYNRLILEVIPNNLGLEYINYSEDTGNTSYAVFEPEQIHILGGRQDIEGFKEFIQGKQFQKLTAEEKARTIEQVTKEHRSITALKDLSAKLAYRIGGKVRFKNRPTVDWKGYNQGMTSVLNEAYMTPDTPFHEILAHPIIRAIKKGNTQSFAEWVFNNNPEFAEKYPFIGAERAVNEKLSKEEKNKLLAQFKKETTGNNQLYQNLLKELETGRGKEVLDRVKRDYVIKDIPEIIEFEPIYTNDEINLGKEYEILGKSFDNRKDAENYQKEQTKHYTLEEQQEEAIVTLLGLMAADKLDAKKDATLISKLKELWKQISDFVKQLLRQDGIIIDELPITTTLNDLAEIMAYGNNHIILPGYKVEYSTPLGNKYETLEEVNQEIRGLANSDVEVDLSNVKLNKEIKGNYYNLKLNEPYYYGDSDFVVYKDGDIFKGINDEAKRLYPKLENKKYYKFSLNRAKWKLEFTEIKGEELKTKLTQNNLAGIYAADDIKDANFTDIEINNFIEKNKKYEQAKKIIELWKKVNNIQYNPEEVYSRGQGFYSSIGAYSNLELDLLLKNLIQHIKDNKKAGGEFTISAFTKPLNTRLKHIEGTGDRVRFVIYPKSNDIKWAANTDVASGSVWDASKKVSKDKKSELLGVSFTKAPYLESLNEVSPNLADIIDNLSHAHNELGIELTTNNFRLEYDEDVRYSTKKLIDNINSILDQKYGKLVKPEIDRLDKSDYRYTVEWNDIQNPNEKFYFKTEKEAIDYATKLNTENGNTKTKKDIEDYGGYVVRFTTHKQGIQPTQTNETLKESISAIQQNLDSRSKVIPNKFVTKGKHKGYAMDTWFYKENGEWYMKYVPFDAPFETKVESFNNQKMSDVGLGIEEVWESYLSTNPEGIEDIKAAEEKYTEQALINLRIAKLKEVARKYPRSLITSRVVPINPNMVDNSEIQYSKVESNSIKDSKVENKVYETDVLIRRFPFSIKGNNTYSVEFINNTSKESYPISVVNDLVYSLNKNNKGKERFVYNPTEKEGYYVINKAVADSNVKPIYDRKGVTYNDINNINVFC